MKMFEAKKINAFGCMDIGDLVIIAEIGGGNRVTAVAEVGYPPVVQEAKREVLYSMLLAERHADLDAYLGDAKTFSYVQFKRVFDVRLNQLKARELLSEIGAQESRGWQQRGLLKASTDASAYAALLALVRNSQCHENKAGMDIW